MVGSNPSAHPTTILIANLAGDFGRNEHILPAAAFVQAFIPLVVFFALQRYFVRGMLAGSVKG
jgi:alpha-glucoside transport system permease protein